MNAIRADHETENILRRTEGGGSGNGNIEVRRLFGPTILLQDWGDTSEGFNNTGNSSHYWELFIDLLLVAAASSIADTFKESHSVSQFTLSYMIVVNGWFLYSYHLSTRFDDSTFVTSLVLFIYLVGFGWSTANIRDYSQYSDANGDSVTTDADRDYSDAYDPINEFIRGATILRSGIYIMLGGIAISLPRARYFCAVMSFIVSSSMIGFMIAFIGTLQDNATIILLGLWIAAITDFFSEIVSSRYIDIKRFIPVNIEQSQERFDSLGLVMLGETVVSITQTFRDLIMKSDDSTNAYIVQQRYYIILTLSLLLIFMMTLNIFHTSPPPEEHALRRSKTHAVTLIFLQKSIGLPLLAIGVSVKLIVEAVMKEEELPLFGYQCMSFGVGTALLCNFCIRLLHHGGKLHLRLGNHKHEFGGTNTKIDRICMIWWYTIAILSGVPFIWYYFGVATQDPMTTMMCHSGLVFVLCFTESTFTHSLLEMIPQPTTNTAIEKIDHSSNFTLGEKQPLLIPGLI